MSRKVSPNDWSAIIKNNELHRDDFIQNNHSRVLGEIDHRQYTATQNAIPEMGNEQYFRIGSRGRKFLDGVTLYTKVSSVSASGGTYARLCNAFPIHMIKSITINQNGSQVWRMTNMNFVYQKILQHSDDEHLYVKKQNLGIGSTSDRDSWSSGDQVFALDLGEFCSLFSVPIPMAMLGDNEIELVIEYRASISDVVETDGTSPTFTFKESHIDVRYIDAGNNPELHDYVDKLVRKGEYRIVDYEPLSVGFNVPSGSQDASHTLSSLQGKHVIYMNITSRDVADINAANFTTYNKLKLYNLDSGGERISGAEYDITDNDFKFKLLPDYGFKGVKTLRDDNLYSISYAHDLSESMGGRHHQYTSSKDFRNINDAKLTIEYPSTLSNSQRVEVDALISRQILILPGRIVSYST